MLDQSQELDFTIWEVRLQVRSPASLVAGPDLKVGLYVALRSLFLSARVKVRGVCIPERLGVRSWRRWPLNGVVKGDLGFYRAGVVKARGVWLEAEVVGEGEKVENCQLVGSYSC